MSYLTLRSDGYYNAFPRILKSANGGLSAVYKSGTGGNQGAVTATLQKMTAQDGMGYGWFTEPSLFSGPSGSYTVQNYGFIKQLANGSFLGCYFQEDTSSPVNAQSFWKTSNDTVTWSASTQFVSTIFDNNHTDVVDVLQLPNGNIAVALYSRRTADTNWSATIQLFSSSMVFISETIIADGNALGYTITEPQIGFWPDGRLSVLVRSDNYPGAESMLQVFSTLDGNGNPGAWSAPVVAFVGSGMPSWVKLASGTVFCTYRNTDASGDLLARAYVSGAWGAAIVIDAGAMEYASPIEISPGTIGIFYSIQISLTQADLRYTCVTETSAGVFSAPFSASPGIPIAGNLALVDMDVAGWTLTGATLTPKTSIILQPAVDGLAAGWTQIISGAGSIKYAGNTADLTTLAVADAAAFFYNTLFSRTTPGTYTMTGKVTTIGGGNSLFSIQNLASAPVAGTYGPLPLLIMNSTTQGFRIRYYDTSGTLHCWTGTAWATTDQDAGSYGLNQLLDIIVTVTSTPGFAVTIKDHITQAVITGPTTEVPFSGVYSANANDYLVVGDTYTNGFYGEWVLSAMSIPFIAITSQPGSAVSPVLSIPSGKLADVPLPVVIRENFLGLSTAYSPTYQYAINGGAFNGTWLSLADLNWALWYLRGAITSVQLKVQLDTNSTASCDITPQNIYGASDMPAVGDVKAGVVYNFGAMTGTLSAGGSTRSGFFGGN